MTAGMDSLTLDLQAVRLRPTRSHKEPRWNAPMYTQHRLGLAKLCIPELRQVSVRGTFNCRFRDQAKEVFAYPLRRRSRKRLQLTTAKRGQLRHGLRRLPHPCWRCQEWPKLLAIMQAVR